MKYCKNCGATLRRRDAACPRCGTPVPKKEPVPRQKGAVALLVFGVLSLVLAGPLGLVFSLLAYLKGRQIKKGPGGACTGMALAGEILSRFGLALSGIVTLAGLVLLIDRFGWIQDHLWRILVDAFPKMLEYGVKITLPLTLLSYLLALAISVAVALIQYGNVPVLKQICRFYVWVIRGTPLLVQLYLIFYGLPYLGIKLDAFLSAVLVFGFNEGAYMAESLRGALEAVPQGQLEAGYCVRMNYVKIMWHIVLPQAFRTAFPALSNSLIGMVKGTSLAATITVTEMFRQAQVINGRVYQPLALYSECAVIYLIFCSVLTLLQRYLEKKLDHYGVQKR